MARPRGTPKTPFGAWLDQWLDEHPEVTLEAFGARVAKAIGRKAPLTDGAISQWLSGRVRRIGADNLRGVSVVTGEPYENLERMVYGNATGVGNPPPEWAELILGQVQSVRRILESSGNYELADQLASADPVTVMKRRGFWIRMARQEKGWDLRTGAKELGTDEATLRRWEKGSADMPNAAIERIAAALGVSRALLERPPETVPEILNRFRVARLGDQLRELEEVVPEGEQRRRRRAVS